MNGWCSVRCRPSYWCFALRQPGSRQLASEFIFFWFVLLYFVLFRSCNPLHIRSTVIKLLNMIVRNFIKVERVTFRFHALYESGWESRELQSHQLSFWFHLGLTTCMAISRKPIGVICVSHEVTSTLKTHWAGRTDQWFFLVKKINSSCDTFWNGILWSVRLFSDFKLLVAMFSWWNDGQ